MASKQLDAATAATTTTTTTTTTAAAAAGHEDVAENSSHAISEEKKQAKDMFVNFTVAKAGMKDVDKQHVQEVVYKLSKDSAFYQNSQRQNERVDARVARMRDQLAHLSVAARDRLQRDADARVQALEASRDLTRTVVVVDMDMFYAAVEMRDNPALRDIPLAVGGMSMISTTNYAARKFGVRAAMPGFIGKELCPELHFVPVDMPKYARVAEQIRAVFAEYDPEFSAFSLDEACLDLTAYLSANWQRYAAAVTPVLDEDEEEKQVGTTCSAPEDEELKAEEMPRWVSSAAGREAIVSAIVRELRRKIFERTQLTASAGIAANTMLAKVCSDMNKPNGQYALPFTREAVLHFIQELSVRKIGGIGKVMEKLLAGALDVHTGRELFEQRAALFHVFSDKTASWLLQTSLGLHEPRSTHSDRKSFSRERTFRNMSDSVQLESKCREICTKLAEDLDAAAMATRNVTLKLKDAKFSVRSRSVSLAVAVSTAEELHANAVELLRRELPLTLRLMGVRAAALEPRRKGENSTEDASRSKKRQLGMATFAEPVAASPSEELFETVAESEEEAWSEPPARRRRWGGVKRQGKSPMKAFLSTDAADEVDEGLSDEARWRPCPICGKSLDATSNMAVNAHMDVCVLGQSRSERRGKPAKTKRKHSGADSQHSIHSFFRQNIQR